MTDLEPRLTDLLARKADEVDVRPVDGFAESPYTTTWVPTDLEPTSVTSAPRRSRRRVVLGVVAAAAVVIVIALVATSDDDRVKPADRPSPTVPPTTLPRALPNAPGTRTYVVDEVSGIPTPRIFVTLGAGWDGPRTDEGGWHIDKSEVDPDDATTLGTTTFDDQLHRAIGVMDFSNPIAVYSDACHWEDGNHPGPVDTLDGVVAALTEQQGWAEVTAPSDISVDGYAGKAFQRTAPADMSNCSTRRYGTRTSDGSGMFPDFRSWENAHGPFGWGGNYYEPGETETLWVLDLGGTVIIISTGAWPEPSAGADADFAADVLDSIHIDDNVRIPDPVGFDTIGASGTNPLELVRGSLTSGADVELFRVATNDPTNWRLTTLAEFDGRTWLLPNRHWSRITDTADSQPDGRTIRQQLQILTLQGQLLPAAADPKQVVPDNNDIRLDRDTSTLLKTSGSPNGNRLTIVSEAPDATLDELRAATTDNPPDEVFLELPDDIPAVVSDLATEVTAAATTDADKMIALQNWFRSEFNYVLTVPASDDGDAIEKFLETREGFCEQFSSTFAVMARTLGIPSRVAVGFTRGTLNADGSYSVFGKNSHAWPEIWFDGIGWIPFEPTPTRAITGAED